MMRAVWVKFLQNIMSVKVWLFFIPFVVSTYYMWSMVQTNFEIIKIYVLPSVQPAQAKLIESCFEHNTALMNNWFKFVSAMVICIASAREIFKVAKVQGLEAKEIKKIAE